DVRAALDWAAANAPCEGADLLTVTRLFQELELHREGIERAKQFAAAIESDDAKRLAQLWTFIASCESGLFANKRAFAAAARAVRFARASGNGTILADALLRYGRSAGFVHRLAEAEAALREAEKVVSLTPRQHLDDLMYRGVVTGFSGGLVASAEASDLVRSLHRSLGNERGELTATVNLAENEHARGQTERAISLAREALSIAVRLKDINGIPHINQNLTGYLMAVNDRAGARAAASNVLHFYATSDPSNPHVPVTLEHLALACGLDGDFMRAARLEGYVENGLRTVGYEREYTEMVTQERLIALLREHFSASELDALFAAGAALTPDEAIAEALV
ncbi:MAG: hypothetical protein M3Z14_04980, partial [Candidatus Eremiobacteraeota bacterium]|nr:hypothetical protein [Candidatus Eremiobacteraeota bacterium]